MEASVERGAAENHDPSDEEHGKSCNRHQRRDQQTLQCYLGVADKAGDKVFYLSHQVSNTKSTAGRPSLYIIKGGTIYCTTVHR